MPILLHFVHFDRWY